MPPATTGKTYEFLKAHINHLDARGELAPGAAAELLRQAETLGGGPAAGIAALYGRLTSPDYRHFFAGRKPRTAPLQLALERLGHAVRPDAAPALAERFFGLSPLPTPALMAALVSRLEAPEYASFLAAPPAPSYAVQTARARVGRFRDHLPADADLDALAGKWTDVGRMGEGQALETVARRIESNPELWRNGERPTIDRWGDAFRPGDAPPQAAELAERFDYNQ